MLISILHEDMQYGTRFQSHGKMQIMSVRKQQLSIGESIFKISSGNPLKSYTSPYKQTYSLPFYNIKLYIINYPLTHIFPKGRQSRNAPTIIERFHVVRGIVGNLLKIGHIFILEQLKTAERFQNNLHDSGLESMLHANRH